MTLPSWTDEKLGTMKRSALWLISVVGEGNIFTKEDVKAAFPGISQADRRVRDLRDYGWQIDTNREDITLGQHEQRFVKPGAPVWEPGKATKSGVSLTQTQRREVLARDGHLCRSATAVGLAAGRSPLIWVPYWKALQAWAGWSGISWPAGSRLTSASLALLNGFGLSTARCPRSRGLRSATPFRSSLGTAFGRLSRTPSH